MACPLDEPERRVFAKEITFSPTSPGEVIAHHAIILLVRLNRNNLSLGPVLRNTDASATLAPKSRMSGSPSLARVV